MFSLGASASSNCESLFDQNGNVIVNSDVCQDDVLLSSLNIFTSSLVADNKAANSIYKAIINDDPVSVTLSAKAIGDVVHQLMSVVSYAASAILFVFVLWRVIAAGLETMKEDGRSNFADFISLKDLWLLPAAALVFPYIDGVSIVIIILFGAVLFSLQVGVYLTTIAFPVVSPTSANLIDGSEIEVFEVQASEYAVGLVKALSVAQDSAIYGSFLSVEAENALLLTGESSKSQGLFGSIWKFFARESRNPTFSEVYEGLFSDYSFSMKMQAPRSGKSSLTSVELFSGKPTDAGITQSPLFVQEYTQNEIFKQANAFSVNHTAPELSKAAFKTVASSSRLSKIANAALIAENDIESVKKVSKSVSQEVLLLVEEVISAHPESHPAAVVNGMQGFLMGTYSVRATQNGWGYANYMFKPFEVPEPKSDEPFFNVLGLAGNALETARRVQCIRFLPQAASEIESFYRLSERDGDLSTDFNKTSKQPHVYPICVHPNSDGTPKLLLSEESIDHAFAIYKNYVSGTDASTLSQRLADLKRELEHGREQGDTPEIETLIAQANEQLAMVKNYYAIIGASSRYAVAEYVGSEDSKLNAQADEELRRKGSMGLPMAFLSSAARMNAFYDALSNAEPQVAIANASEEETNWISRRVISRNVERQLAAVNVNQKIEFLFSDQPEMAAGSSTQGTSSAADEISDFFVLNALEHLIPNSSLFAERLGLQGDNLAAGLAGCSTSETCIQFRGHPVHSVIEFSAGLFNGAVAMLVLDAIMQNLKSVTSALTGGGSESDGGITGQLMNYGKKFVSKAIPVVGALAVFVSVAAMITSILAKFAIGALIISAVGSIMMPTQILYAYIKQVLEAIVLNITTMLLLPVMIALSIVQIEGRALLSALTTLKTCLSSVLSLVLIPVSVVVFVATSYVSVYLANTMGGVAMVSVMQMGSGQIMIALFAIVSVLVWIGMVIFSILAALKIACSVTSIVQRSLGLENMAGQLTDDLGSIFAVATLSHKVKETHQRSKTIGVDLKNKVKDNASLGSTVAPSMQRGDTPQGDNAEVEKPMNTPQRQSSNNEVVESVEQSDKPEDFSEQESIDQAENKVQSNSQETDSLSSPKQERESDKSTRKQAEADVSKPEDSLSKKSSNHQVKPNVESAVEKQEKTDD